MRYASPNSVLHCRRFPGRRLLLLCRAHATRLEAHTVCRARLPSCPPACRIRRAATAKCPSRT